MNTFSYFVDTTGKSYCMQYRGDFLKTIRRIIMEIHKGSRLHRVHSVDMQGKEADITQQVFRMVYQRTRKYH